MESLYNIFAKGGAVVSRRLGFVLVPMQVREIAALEKAIECYRAGHVNNDTLLLQDWFLARAKELEAQLAESTQEPGQAAPYG